MSKDSRTGTIRRLRLFLIKPSHYDADGYAIQWFRSDMPSNTMAVLNGLAQDCARRRVLGPEVEIAITAIDEMHTRIRPERIIRELRDSGERGLIALVGVQSNQFPRAVDLARPFRAAGIDVCLGGFHVSGSIAMLPQIPPEIREAMDLGISIYCGEAEERFEEVLRDAFAGELKPMYNAMDALPALQGAVCPELPEDLTHGSLSLRGSFDAGRGCPFQCSFCTVINVQGRRSRFRDADDIEALLRRHHARGVFKFFITDDNFARNKNWQAIFERIIELREREGMKFRFMLQVDTLAHQVEGFIETAARAGVDRVFIGLENINPDNLATANKRQNQIAEYRAMLQAWKRIGVITMCGYIIGFPHDTPERVQRDIGIIQRELPTDFISFFCLTPLPGSQDHRALYTSGAPLDPDLNNYDTEHVTADHPLMSRAEFYQTYRAAWDAFYTMDHLETTLRRAAACGISPRTIAKLTLYYYGSQSIDGINPMQGGLFRRKYRRDRRHGMPIENPLVFYAGYGWQIVSRTAKLVLLAAGVWQRLRRVERDRNRQSYTDLALTPIGREETQNLELIRETNRVARTAAPATP
ncbi:MAG: radical SAM protein [Gammaproteobacteria bacterium]|nr:radical SAM protein [Gammaproteobacteria bacterium]